MARNRDNTRPNKHKIICGQSGSGKTTFVTQCQDIKRSNRVLFWDPYHDHKCEKRFTTIKDLTRFLSGCLKRGTGFKAALSIEDVTPENMCIQLDQFYDLVWLIADGEKETHVIVEEIADGYDTVAKAKGRGGQVFRAGRSFGIVLYAITQSTSEIPKTIVKQCGTKIIFNHCDYSDMKRAAELAGRRPDDISALKCGEYYMRLPGVINGELKRTKRLTR